MKRIHTLRQRTGFQTLLLFAGIFVHVSLKAQVIDSIYLQKPWKASWIMVPGSSPTGYGVYYFRKAFDLTTVPKTYPIHVSADNRYKLYINETLVSIGPARGDVLHWNFETVDLAPFLQAGRNVVVARVWNEGELRPEANSTFRTGFILQGGNADAQILNTNSNWKCRQDSSYSPFKVIIPTFFVAGPGEKIDMQRYVRNWEKPSYVDDNWPMAKPIGPAFPKYKTGYGGPAGWLLVPSPLPQMEMKPQRLASIRKADGVQIPTSFPATKVAVTIPAYTTATLLLDQTYLTNAYPTLIFSGGNRSRINLGYAEALFTKYPAKGNRNEVEGKTLIGRQDSLVSDGSDHQVFTTLSWRTFRYLQLNITTRETPLVLDDLYATFTGFPFALNARLETDNAELKAMMEIGWRTARLCATETYMDCPYYEQLQYIGDTRIQALVSLYNSGDDRLVRNALNQIDYSRQPEGITQSRYPTSTSQYIPPFSLWYIGMLHDYMRYGKDLEFVKKKLASNRQILSYFSSFQHPDGSVKNLPWWNFTDWVNDPKWPIGTRLPGKDGYSALLDLQLLWAYQLAADLENRLGIKELALLYTQQATQLKKTIRQKYWDSSRKLLADRSEKDLFSQHTNALAILTEVVTGQDARMIGQQLTSDSTLAPASIYFKYYLHQALTKAGLGNDYLSWLGKWRENMKMGLTTWAETSELTTTRSDCHAWGASPNIEFFRILLGIDSQAPGFASVKIEPHLGNLKTIGGTIPHPNGEIRVKYAEAKGHLQADIHLPAKTTGQFIWKGKRFPLKEGKNSLKI